MKTFLLLFGLALSCSAASVTYTPQPVPFCAARFMRCTRAIETPRGQRVGRHGEQGPYQMTRAARSDNGSAARHLAWLRSHLHNPTVERLALAWNAGLDACEASRVTPEQRDHARRLANLYDDPTF
jgi:hypothetical protein